MTTTTTTTQHTYLVIDADLGGRFEGRETHRIAAPTAEDAAREYWYDQDGDPRRPMDVWVRPALATDASADEFFAFEEEEEVNNG